VLNGSFKPLTSFLIRANSRLLILALDTINNFFDVWFVAWKSPKSLLAELKSTKH